MRILISAANGFLGTALIPFLERQGHTVDRLVRRPERESDIAWNPERSELDNHKLAGFDAVIHLAGANIAATRWNEAYKKEIGDSRIKSTELLVQKFGQMAPPKTFVSMSGVGYYGSCGDRWLDESSPAGNDFMAQLSTAWENASKPLVSTGTRVVNLRTGVVLSPNGGALAKMLPIFKLGLGGRLGDGTQYWSWISLPDFLAAVDFILNNDAISGAVNMTAPNPVTNREFTVALAKALHRPAWFPVPAFALRTMFGQMADAVFFASQRTAPKVLANHGFDFGHSDLKFSLSTLLSK